MNKRVTVVGDFCSDLYWVGTLGGLSAEAPVPVVKQTSVLALPGMSGNVRRIIQDLGGVATQLITGEHIPIKNRLVTQDGKQLARWDVEDWCDPLTREQLQDLGPQDAVIVSDYGKGAIGTDAVYALRSLAEAGTPLFIDTKGDPFTWAGLDNVTLFPNGKEYAEFKSRYDWMPSVVWKQSSDGVSHLRFGKQVAHVRAACVSPVNVCGAGDVVVAAYVKTLLETGDPLQALEATQLAAGAYVQRPFYLRYLDSQREVACQ